MKIALLHHYDENNDTDTWNTPLGIKLAFERLGHTVTRFGFMPNSVNFSKLISEDKKQKFDFVFIMYAGPSESLDMALSSLKFVIKCPIVLELGDEPQTYYANQKRINLVHLGLSPDLRCVKEYQKRNLNVQWFTHWCDTEIFKPIDLPRKNIVITTCEDGRPHVKQLKEKFGDSFVQKRLWYYENTQFFNSGMACFQYARYDEITRRIMEAGGCKLAVITNDINRDTGIYDLFEDGKDIIYYHDYQDCENKIQELLNNPTKSRIIGNNMYDKITKYHTVDIRVRDLIEMVKKI